jgi:hypothetical protein
MHKRTTVKNPRANGILERVHQELGQMLHTAELDTADSVTPDDVDVFLDNAAWACHEPLGIPGKEQIKVVFFVKEN